MRDLPRHAPMTCAQKGFQMSVIPHIIHNVGTAVGLQSYRETKALHHLPGSCHHVGIYQRGLFGAEA
jgi:hypothetical protein